MPTGKPWTPQWLLPGIGLPVGASFWQTVFVGIVVEVGTVVNEAVVMGAMEVSMTQLSVGMMEEKVVVAWAVDVAMLLVALGRKGVTSGVCVVQLDDVGATEALEVVSSSHGSVVALAEVVADWVYVPF